MESAIPAESEYWDADCIFVGLHGLNGTDPFIPGTVRDPSDMDAHRRLEVVG